MSDQRDANEVKVLAAVITILVINDLDIECVTAVSVIITHVVCIVTTAFFGRNDKKQGKMCEMRLRSVLRHLEQGKCFFDTRVEKCNWYPKWSSLVTLVIFFGQCTHFK